MTTESGRRNAELTKNHHKKDEYGAAVESYTAAAYEYLGQNGLRHTPSSARGLRHLIVAATCLRHTNERERCENLCWQGAKVSEAIAAHTPEVPEEADSYDLSVRGIWDEFAGDFKTVSELPDVGSSYDRAKTAFLNAGDPMTNCFEHFHMAPAVMPKLVFHGTDADTDELDSVLSYGATLTD